MALAMAPMRGDVAPARRLVSSPDASVGAHRLIHSSTRVGYLPMANTDGADDDERRGDAARARAGAHARAFAWDRARVARARDVRRMAIDPAMRPCVAPAGAAEDGDEDDEGGEGGTEDARGRATGEDDANDANR